MKFLWLAFGAYQFRDLFFFFGLALVPQMFTKCMALLRPQVVYIQQDWKSQVCRDNFQVLYLQTQRITCIVQQNERFSIRFLFGSGLSIFSHPRQSAYILSPRLLLREETVIRKLTHFLTPLLLNLLSLVADFTQQHSFGHSSK